MTDSAQIEQLQRGLELLIEANKRHSDRDVRQLIRLLHDWRWSFGSFSLDRALGAVPDPGQRTPLTDARLARRNEIVAQAVAMFFGDETRAAAARQMNVALAKYASGAWLRERRLDYAPEHRTGTLEGALWRILSIEDRVLSERSIRRILATS